MQKRKKIAQYFKTKILSLLSLLPPGPISALEKIIQFLLQRAKNQIFCTVFDTHLIKAKKALKSVLKHSSIIIHQIDPNP